MGLLLALTGDLGDMGSQLVAAADLAVKEMNAAGGPLGRKITLVSEDERTDAQTAVRAAQKLVFTDKVTSIVGPSSDSILALLDFAKSNKVPIISQWAGTDKLITAGGNYVYRVVASDSFGGVATAKFLADQGFKKAAVLYENDESPESTAKSMSEEFKKLGGQIVASVAFNPGQTSFQAELKKTFDPKPEVVLLSTGAEAGAAVLKEWYRGGYGGKWFLGADLPTDEFVKQVGPSVMQGMYGQIPGDDTESPSYKRFAKIWKEKTGKDEVPSFATNMYDAFILQGLAIEAGKAATGEAIAANIRQVSGGQGKTVTSFEEGIAELRKGNKINYEGASGPVDLDEHGNVAAGYSIVQVKGDKWGPVKFYSGQDLGKLK